MAFDPLTAILNLGGTIIDRVLPDKAANDAAKAQLASDALKGEYGAIMGQLEVNKVEAASQNWFVAGWRPLIGWTSGFALAYTYILQPFIQTLLVVFHSSFDPAKLPVISSGELFALVSSMLGLGAMRSYDKAQGTGNGH